MLSKMKYVPSGHAYSNPSFSNASINTCRRCVYSLSCVSKYPRASACSMPVAAASCMGEFGQNTMRVVAATLGPISAGGPISHPIRQPVAAKSSARNG